MEFTSMHQRYQCIQKGSKERKEETGRERKRERKMLGRYEAGE